MAAERPPWWQLQCGKQAKYGWAVEEELCETAGCCEYGAAAAPTCVIVCIRALCAPAKTAFARLHVMGKQACACTNLLMLEAHVLAQVSTIEMHMLMRSCSSRA